VDAGKVEGAVRDLLPSPKALSPWVRVVYRAVDRDTIGADDPIRGEGEGVIYRGKDGSLLVLTGRSASDGTWLMRDHWYDRLRIARERIRVVLADGRVLDARRVWTAEKADLAVLRVEPPPGEPPPDLPPWRKYLSFGEGAPSVREKGGWKGTVLLKDQKGRAWGIGGFARYRRRVPVTAPFRLVPPEFRPKGSGEGK